MIFSSIIDVRPEEVGGDWQLWGVQTRDAFAYGPSTRCVCHCLGAVSGKVGVASDCWSSVAFYVLLVGFFFFFFFFFFSGRP